MCGRKESLVYLRYVVWGQHNFEFRSVSTELTSIWRAMKWKCIIPSWQSPVYFTLLIFLMWNITCFILILINKHLYLLIFAGISVECVMEVRSAQPHHTFNEIWTPILTHSCAGLTIKCNKCSIIKCSVWTRIALFLINELFNHN